MTTTKPEGIKIFTETEKAEKILKLINKRATYLMENYTPTVDVKSMTSSEFEKHFITEAKKDGTVESDLVLHTIKKITRKKDAELFAQITTDMIEERPEVMLKMILNPESVPQAVLTGVLHAIWQVYYKMYTTGERDFEVELEIHL